MARDRDARPTRGMATTPPPAVPTQVGGRLRAWRERAGLSQHRLALEAGLSARHLSFVETGRARPGAELIARIAERLGVPAAERNAALVTAGYAPVYAPVPVLRPYADAAFDVVRDLVDATLARHRPFPAYLVDRHWHIVASNGALPVLYEGVAPALLQPPVNVVRLLLHPAGLAPRVAELSRWRGYYVAQLRRQVARTRDPQLGALLRDVLAYPGVDGAGADGAGDVRDGAHGAPRVTPEAPPPVMPLTVTTRLGVLSFLTATAVLGIPADVTAEEVALELMLPADHATEVAVLRLDDAPPTAEPTTPSRWPR